MSNVNKWIGLGRLTRDPELRFTNSGTEVTDFGMAIKRVFKAGDETREETTFVDIVAWGRQAKLIADSLSKGQRIYIEGRLKLEQWETDTGEKRSKLRVHAENFQFIERREEAVASGANKATNMDDEEVPF